MILIVCLILEWQKLLSISELVATKKPRGVTASIMHQLLQISSLIDNLKTFYQCNPEATRTKGYLERFAKHKGFYGSDLYPDQ